MKSPHFFAYSFHYNLIFNDLISIKGKVLSSGNGVKRKRTRNSGETSGSSTGSSSSSSSSSESSDTEADNGANRKSKDDKDLRPPGENDEPEEDKEVIIYKKNQNCKKKFFIFVLFT